MSFIVKLILNIFAIHHRKIILIWTSYLWQLVFIYMCGNSSRSSSPWNLPLIALISCQEIFWTPIVLFAFLRIFLHDFVSSFDPYQVCVDVRQTFSFRYLCHCEKCRGFGLYVGTLLFWELVISFLLLWFICLDEINLWACDFYYYSFMLNMLLGSFVE
jgi:hypothetical protein